MAKIQVNIVILDEGVFLMHTETGLLFECVSPYSLVGRLNQKTKKIEYAKTGLVTNGKLRVR
jgi:hypothetical protein